MVSISWLGFWGVVWLFVAVSTSWEEGVIVVGVGLAVLGVFWGGIPGPTREASISLLTLELEVLLLVVMYGEGDVGGDGLSSPWSGGRGRGGSIGPRSEIM